MTITGDINYDRWRFQKAGDGYEIRKENVSLSNALLLPIKPFNLVDAAQQVTPLSDLWTFKANDSTLRAFAPFSETRGYYYDLQATGDDCTVFHNAWRRQYSITGGGALGFGTTESQVKGATNVEIAISARKDGTGHTRRWFPFHGVNTAVLVGSRTFRRDGVVFTANDSAYQKCESTSIQAAYDFIHPEEADSLARINLEHVFTSRKLAISVSVQFMQDTDINLGYSIMNNVSLTPKSAAVGIGRNLTPVTLTAGNQAAPGQGRITNCAMGQTGDSTVLIADWSSNLRSVLASQVFTNPSLFQWFADTSNKYYNQPFSNCVIPAGQSFSWKGEFRLAEWASLFS